MPFIWAKGNIQNLIAGLFKKNFTAYPRVFQVFYKGGMLLKMNSRRFCNKIKWLVLLLFATVFVLDTNTEAKTSSADNLPKLLSSAEAFQTGFSQEPGGIEIDIEGFVEQTPFRIKGTLGRPNQESEQKSPWFVHLNVETDLSSLQIDGTVRDPQKLEGMNLNFVLTSQDLSEIARILGENFASTEPFTFKANLKDIRPRHYELSRLHAAIGKTTIKGSCSLNFSGDKPEIEAGFFSSLIDVRNLLAAKPDQAEKEISHDDKAEKNQVRNSKIFSRKAIDLSFLEAFDLKLELLAEKLISSYFAVKNCHLKTSVKAGTMSVDSLNGAIGEGRLTGSFSVGPCDQGVDASVFMDIDQMNLEPMLEDMQLDIDAKGMVDFSVNLNSRGKSMADLMAGLAGSTNLVMGQGRIDQKYLDYLGLFKITLFSSLMNLLNISPDSNQEKGVSETNCFAIRFDMAEGIADLSAMVLDTRQTTFMGSGKIDLGREKLDISLRPIPKEGVGPGGIIKFDISLSELTRVLYLGGTLANPNVAVDTTQTFVTLGKAIGGVVLFGPAGAAAALLTGKIGKDSQNLCLEAAEAAREGVELERDDPGILNLIENLFRRINPLH